MKRNVVLALFIAALLPLAAVAAQRTFVSGAGSDLGACTLAAPCRTLQKAVNAVDPGGEVVALDSAGYGVLAIAKSVQVIVPPGVHAAISALSGNAVSISGAFIDVVLRGLYLTNSGTATTGIVWSANNGSLVVENCVINGFFTAGGGGIRVSSPVEMTVKDTIIRTNQGIGISVNTSSGSARALIEHVRVERSGSYGIWAGNNSTVTVRDTVAYSNSNNFVADAATGTAEMTIENSLSTHGFRGVLVGISPTGASFVRLSGSTISDNSIGVQIGATGSVVSSGNNNFRGNPSDVSGGTMTNLGQM